VGTSDSILARFIGRWLDGFGSTVSSPGSVGGNGGGKPMCRGRGRGRGDVCVHTLRMPGEPPLTQSLSISRSLRLPRSAVGEPVRMGGM
jgi:hypothetical protein